MLQRPDLIYMCNKMGSSAIIHLIAQPFMSVVSRTSIAHAYLIIMTRLGTHTLLPFFSIQRSLIPLLVHFH